MLKALNIPNMITISRVFFLIPILYLMNEGENVYAAIVILVAASTDFLDGIAARRLSKVTDAGKALDPIADKICVIFVSGYLVLYRGFPLWLLGMIVTRDTIISTLGLKLKRKTGTMPEANMPGKISLNAILFLIFSYVLEIDVLKQPLLWISVVLLVYSFGVYIQEYKSKSVASEGITGQ